MFAHLVYHLFLSKDKNWLKSFGTKLLINNVYVLYRGLYVLSEW